MVKKLNKIVINLSIPLFPVSGATGTEIADREKSPPHPLTPSSSKELVTNFCLGVLIITGNVRGRYRF